MIFLDTTNAGRWRHASGLSRVSGRLSQGLGTAASALAWPEFAARPSASDWILTPELFSEAERPGFTAFLAKPPCRVAAIYHDAIPIKFPAITWPASVARHPSYMKLLAQFDRVWAVSEASREELVHFWRWQGLAATPPVSVLALGADGLHRERATVPSSPSGPKRVVAIGILEPRKNQEVLLGAFEVLRAEGLDFELHLVGRVNPHFGPPLLKRVEAVSRRFRGIFHHQEMSDSELVGLLGTARCTAFPSIAEGCGLPVLESLWLGVPCLCSDIPSVAENAAGGGCGVVEGNTAENWCRALRHILTDDRWHENLVQQALGRDLPTWAAAAETIGRNLSGGVLQS